MLEIPVRNDLPAYEFTILIENRVYAFSFRYNFRMKRWIMDIKTSDGEPLVMGILILVEQSLLGRFKNEELPEGMLIALNLGREHVNPEREDFGENVKLLYQ